MNDVRNEEGYTLVIVLLIVIIFMVLFLSFMGQALSSVKQNKVVEKKSLSVSAAEMGISYYQVEVQRIFESKQENVSEYIKANSSLQADFKRNAAIQMAAELQNVFPKSVTQPSVSIDGDANASFIMKNFEASADSKTDPKTGSKTNPNNINISFDIIGTENKKESTLKAKMSINLDSITNQSTIDDTNNYVLPNFETVKNEQINECKSLTCDNVYINGNGRFTDNNSIKDNQTIYVTGYLQIDGNGNENNNTNVKIHSDGYINIGKNMNSQSNVVIETKDSATFGQNLKMTGASNLLVFKNLTVQQHLELANSSFAFVGGGNLITASTPQNLRPSATIDKLDIQSSSKMCVNGDLNAKSISVDDSAKLYVLGRVLENNVKITKYKTDSTTFTKECGKYVPPDFQIKWGDNVNTVINDVTYN